MNVYQDIIKMCIDLGFIEESIYFEKQFRDLLGVDCVYIKHLPYEEDEDDNNK